MKNWKVLCGAGAAILFLVFLQTGALKKGNESFSRGCPWIHATSTDGGKSFLPSFKGCDCVYKNAVSEFDQDELSKIGVILEAFQIPGYQPTSNEIVMDRRFSEWFKSANISSICEG